jgi:hypothetical protein
MLLDEVSGVPDPDARLKDSDTLFIAGTVGNLQKISRLR